MQAPDQIKFEAVFSSINTVANPVLQTSQAVRVEL